MALTLVGFAAVTASSARKTVQNDNRNKFIGLLFIGALIGSIGRFAAAAPSGQTLWIYALIYNGSYMLPSFIIIIMLSVRPNLIFLKNNKKALSPDSAFLLI